MPRKKSGTKFFVVHEGGWGEMEVANFTTKKDAQFYIKGILDDALEEGGLDRFDEIECTIQLIEGTQLGFNAYVERKVEVHL